MKYFYRSLRYMKPYRGRIGVALFCTLCIAALWGGGLGLVVPGAKILLDEQGLHGWTYESLAQDHLLAKVHELNAGNAIGPEKLRELYGLSEPGKLLNIDINEKEEKSPARQAGIPNGGWIVGIDGQRVLGAAALRRLAQADPGQTLALEVYTPKTGPLTYQATMAKEGFTSRTLKYLAVTPQSNGRPLLPEPKDYDGRYPLFLVLLAIVLVMTVLRAVFTFIQEYLVGTAIWLGIMDLRCENYNVVLHLPTTFFSEKGVSDATSRFIQDTNELARGQNTLLGKTMVEPAKAVACICLALYYSWELTLMVMLAGPPAFLMIRKLGKSMHKAAKRALESWSLMLGMLGETLIGIRVVKSYTMEGQERRRFFRVNRSLLKQQMKKERLDALTGPIVETLGIAAGMAAAAAAGYLVFMAKHMDSAYFLGWMVALFATFDPVRKLAKVTMRFSESDAAAKRIFDLQDTPQEKSVLAAPTLPRHAKSIEFRNISFRYPSAGEDALRDVSLTIKAGQTVAFVGPNGSGKTTLISLVPRLLDPRAGQVLIDGHDVSQHSVRSLRRQIALVTQESILFHATIGENIAYGKRRAHADETLSAARKAYVDEFVRDLPNGYNTMVGEHGATLSGGQRQRIAIARAIVRDPAILIFDEALSQIDPDSEAKIHAAMSEFRTGRTCLVIAHRFNTIMDADQIVVMDGGRIIDAGPHEKLLERCPLYRALYQRQYSAGEAVAK